MTKELSGKPKSREEWRVVSYIGEMKRQGGEIDTPSIILENCDTRERLEAGIYGTVASGWYPLVLRPANANGS